MWRNMNIYEQKYVYIYELQKYVYIYVYRNIYIYVQKYVYIYYLIICKFLYRNVYALLTGNPINSYIRIFRFGIRKNTYFLGINTYFISIKISI